MDENISISIPVTRMGQYLYFLAHGGDFNKLPLPVTTEDHCWYYICKYGIKTFINGDSGSVWHNGKGDPNATTPENAKLGDYYIDTDTGKYHVKNTETTWNHIGTLQGIAGEDGATWLNGNANPPQANEGKEGDYYLNDNSGMYWKKVQNVWQEQGTLRGVNGVVGPQGNPGRDGSPGSRWFNGDALPDVNSVNVRDYFIDNTNGDYHEKVGTSWVKQGNLKGPQGDPGSPGTPGQPGAPGKNGTNLIIGDQDPNQINQPGELNDIYINKTTWDVYKYSNTSWIHQGNIKGAKGDKGDPGQAESNTNISSAGTIKYPSIERTYQSGWQNAYGDTTGMVRYYKIGEMVNMHGIVNGVGKSTNTYGQHMFTLSAGYRPKRVMYFPVATFKDWNFSVPSTGMISIETDGRVRFYGGYTELISLAGITFTTAH